MAERGQKNNGPLYFVEAYLVFFVSFLLQGRKKLPDATFFQRPCHFIFPSVF